MRSVVCEVFCAELESHLSEIMREQYWEGGIDTDALAAEVEARALEQGVNLTDVSEFDFDGYFHGWYQILEKGLS